MRSSSIKGTGDDHLAKRVHLLLAGRWLATALDDLAELDPRPERVVIEASGADPAGIAAYCHRRPYRLDLVVVLADVEAIAVQVVDDYVGERCGASWPP